MWQVCQGPLHDNKTIHSKECPYTWDKKKNRELDKAN